MMFSLLNRWSAVCAAGLLTACTSLPPGPIELVETTPIGTVLGSTDLPETAEVWRHMIDRAEHSIVLSQFYLVTDPSGLLDGIIERIEAAAHRGVDVRILVGEKFYATYPELIDRFDENPDIKIRRWNIGELTGGVQHSKYIIVDGKEVYLGSANFDWRSLEHIQELGLHLDSPGFAASLLDVFEHDWALAAGQTPPAPTAQTHYPLMFRLAPGQVGDRMDPQVALWPAFSPKGLLPVESEWDLPRIQDLIQSSQRSLFLQLLTLDFVDKQGQHFVELEKPLLEAADRGVRVRILVADCGQAWCDRGPARASGPPGHQHPHGHDPGAPGGHIPRAGDPRQVPRCRPGNGVGR
ncbi:MAG: phospholipase D-like domain-containing protein [Planctomycetota bacterium]